MLYLNSGIVLKLVGRWLVVARWNNVAYKFKQNGLEYYQLNFLSHLLFLFLKLIIYAF